tara:strand:+ start:539 stop:1129 length:591 start_codon:yes stop_codon:yes gene_type:complete
MPAWAWIAAAIAAKMYGTKKQADRYKEIKRDRSASYAAAQRKKDKLTEEAFAKAKETRAKFKRSAVDEATGNEAAELTEAFSQMPRREFAAPKPIRHGEPTVITNAQNTADTNALSRINRYAQDSAGLQALTGAFDSSEQQNTAMMNRAAIAEKARRQREIMNILGLRMGEISDPYSEEAQMAGGLGDVLMMGAMA